jgi:cytochrome P450
MGRNPNIWKDPLKYEPMRWFEDGKMDAPKKASTAMYPAFHMMPRLCLGKPLAEMEIGLLTAILASKYEFKSVGPLSDEFASTLTLPMKNGLKVKASRRNVAGESKLCDVGK